MSIKQKSLAVLIIVFVCMFVLNSCRWSEVPAQECYPPDTTGVESVEKWKVVWDGVVDDVSETTYIEDGGQQWAQWGTIDNRLDAVGDDATNETELVFSCDSLDTYGLGDITAPDVDTHWTISTAEWIDPPYSVAIEEWLELYKEYETECRNDSTSGIIVNYDNLDVVDGWIHKDPTLIGFIKYLRGL